MRTRRQVLAALGTGVAALAGCQTGSPEPSDTTETPGDTATTTSRTTSSSTSTSTEATTTTLVENPLFGGGKHILVVNGYSTSRHWPERLQEKFDRYHGRRQLWVEKAIQAGSPIPSWIDPDTGDPTSLWRDTLAPAIEQQLPVVLLAQQSLQRVFGERDEGIEGPDDTVAIERGANVLQRYTAQAMKTGAKSVFLATHIYKQPLEPVIGNERLALEAALDRGINGLHAGPDVWTPTKEQYPAVYRDDGVHPNRAGSEIMAQYWFERLLESADLAVPQWSRAEMQEAIDRVSAQ